MLKEDSGTLVGNDRYEGYSVDLVDAISQILGFNYTIKLGKLQTSKSENCNLFTSAQCGRCLSGSELGLSCSQLRTASTAATTRRPRSGPA